MIQSISACVRRRRLGLALLASVFVLFASASARAQCFSGEDATGLEVGNRTLSVTLPNTSPTTLLLGSTCEPSDVPIFPISNAQGTGEARILANELGWRSYTAIQVGGLGSGGGGSTAIGSVRYLIRARTTPGYTGPTTVGIEVSMLADVAGQTTVSGFGSASGTFTTSVTMRLASGGGDENLFEFDGSGGFAGAGSPTLLQAQTTIAVDVDYVLQIVHSQNVQASYSQGGMGQAGSAQSNGSVALSWQTDLVAPEPGISIEYAMVDALGVGPPGLGHYPVFPPPVPGLGPVGLVLAALGGCALGKRGLARQR